MFPSRIKTGLSTITTKTPNQRFAESMVCAALNQIGNQAILDTAILYQHHQAAHIYYLQDLGVVIPEDSDGYYVLYTKDEEKEIRADLMNVVMKFHCIDEAGLATKLTPLITAFETDTEIDNNLLADPFIRGVFNKCQEYNNMGLDTMQKYLENMVNFENESILVAMGERSLLESYGNLEEDISVAIFEDGFVQCGCDHCENFFQVVDKEVKDPNSLNFIQRAMLESYNNFNF